MIRVPTLLARLALAPLLALAAACSSFTVQAPTGFVELDDESVYDWRATSADGVVFSVRALEHDPVGALDFWVKVIENHLRDRGGYALLGKEKVSTGAGLAGMQLRFGHDEGQTPHLYTVTVFVTDDYIYLLEAGGTKELMTKEAPQLAALIQGFQP